MLLTRPTGTVSFWDDIGGFLKETRDLAFAGLDLEREVAVEEPDWDVFPAVEVDTVWN